MFSNRKKKPNCSFASGALWLFINLIPTLCQAEFQDPTKPDYPKTTLSGPDNALAQGRLVLSAIWITASEKWATINGVTAKQGQTILNKVKIIKISQNAVSISYNGSIKKLHLLRPLYKSQ